jgi:putative GTP pyrophosphokinase
MAWPTLRYTRSQVNKAGKILRDQADYEAAQIGYALNVLSNWRACHGYPINTFQATLRKKLTGVDDDPTIAQRLKRMPSIINKLKLQRTMQLTTMQDIGGLRAVVKNIQAVRALEAKYLGSKQFPHTLMGHYDYINTPKASGYRSVHLVYKYSKIGGCPYDGLLLELQIRTRVQHAWATAVETVGTMIDHALKSSLGPPDWLNFFSVASAALAHYEGTAKVQGYEVFPKRETYRMFIEEAERLDVKTKLRGIAVAINAIDSRKRRFHYNLIILNFEERRVRVKGFGQNELALATEAYTVEERNIAKGKKAHAVLVSAGSVDLLKRAYPNYFLDTHQFLKLIDSVERRFDKL